VFKVQRPTLLSCVTALLQKTLSDFARGGCLISEMQEQSDTQLLCDYAEHGHEAAFREIVSRHADVVYASALRQAGSPDLAQDIAQSVFADLARKARSLAGTLNGDVALLGWLYRSTRFAALNQLRDDRRRLARERLAMQQLDPAAETAPQWERVQPVLDEAMAELSDEDREALLLRFFKDRDFRAIAAALGISDDAAQKRVSRALERLRTGLTSRGVTTTAGALSALLMANSVSFAPAGLAATLSTAALAGTTLAATATATATKAIAVTTLQKTLIAATLAVAVCTGIYEARQTSVLREQNQTLRQQQAPLTEQNEAIARERDDVARQLAALQDEKERLNRNTAELLKLRAEVSRLRSDSQAKAADAPKENNPVETETRFWVARMNQLKHGLEQTPAFKIPEFQLLSDDIWLGIAQRTRNINLDTDAGMSEALSHLREISKQLFAPIMAHALVKFTQAHEGQLPANISELKPYFNYQVDDGTLQQYQTTKDQMDAALLHRYHLTKTGNVSDLQPRETVIAENSPVDSRFDTLYQIGLNAWLWKGTSANSNHSGSGSWEIPSPQVQPTGK